MEEKKPVSHLLELVKNHNDYLQKYQEEIIKPLAYFTFPTKTLIAFYEKQLMPKLTARIKKSEILSDIMMWYTPKLIGLAYQIQSFIVSLTSEQRNANINAIKQDLPMDCTTETMLRVPLIFLEETIISHVRSSIRYSKDKNWNVEAKSLTRFTDIYETFLHDYLKTKATREQIQQMVLKNLYPDAKKTRVAVKFATRIAFIVKLKQRVKKAESRLKDRKNRLLELIDGEKKYIQGLQDYILYIKKPIEQLNVLSQEENLKLFSTIEPILTFHTHFLKQLNKKFQNYSKYQTYGDIFSKNIPFFKIYTDYIMYADEAEKILLAYQEENEEVDEICCKFMNEKEKKASDQLKQPTFRIARYDMILTEVIKKTNPSHPDYPHLVKAQSQFVGLLRKVNTTVDVTFRRNRLNQLDQEFGTEERPIFIQNRQFLEQFSLFMVRDEKLDPVMVFIFSDFVMIIDQNRKILKWITIDLNFYVRREQDNKIYRNIIKIHSDGFLTFSAGSEDKNFNKAEQFYDLLCKVSRENEEFNQIVYVQVLGTEEIGSTSFAKHTEYIVEIKYMGLRKFLHLRFSEMKPLLNKIQTHYKDDLNITQEESLKKNWFNNHKSKTIQDRKRTIEQILQKILNHEVVKKQPQFVLELLGIEMNFLKMNESPSKKRESIIANHSHFLNSNITNTTKSKKKESKQAETILCATEIKLGRDMYHDPEESFLEKKKPDNEKIQIYISTMVDEEPIVVTIDEFYTVEDVCYKVSKLIGLRMNKDFRLFHEIGKKELRVLDPQQKIMKIFSFPKKEIKVTGVFSDFLGSIKRIVAPDTHPTLIFKKYYFMPVEIEQAQARKDLTRLRLLVYQIFDQIKEMKYQLTFDEYLLFLAMMVYIEFDGKVPEEPDQSFVNRLIPETIFKLKNYSLQQWLAKCRPHAKRLEEQIQKIIDYNRQQLKNKKIKADSVSKTALYFGHRHLCSQIVINKIKNNPIYGSNLFYVQPYKSTYDKLMKENKKMAYNMWLAIKVESLNLLYPSSKETVLQLHYKDIEKIFVYSEAIIFKMDGLITTQYRLNTYQSFEISQLVKYNKALNETLKDLERDEDLISKARSYKQQILIYRNTYDKSNNAEENKK